MKLAEALLIRADLQKKVAQLKARLKDSAKVQEGDEPAEDVTSLFKELNDTLSELEDLIFRINMTNTNTVVDGESLTHMMARKDVLTTRLSVMRELIAHVTESDTRYGRNEIRYIRTIDVAKLRRETEQYSKQLRELDVKIQGLNLQAELI